MSKDKGSISERIIGTKDDVKFENRVDGDEPLILDFDKEFEKLFRNIK